MKINKRLSYVLVMLLLVLITIAGKNSMTSEGKKEDNSTKHKTVKIFLDDKLVEFSENPVVKEGSVYVPISDFAKDIDVQVKFKTSGKIIIKKGDKNLVINTNDNTVITEENKSFFMDSINKGKRTLLPVEMVSKHFGFTALPFADNSIKVYSEARAKELSVMVKVVNEVEEPKEESSLQENVGKVAYLTFDDGPNANTSQILDILKEKNVKATFFMLGSSIMNHMDITKRVSEEGHGLGVHSMTHNFKSVYASPSSFLSEMNSTNDVLEKATGQRTLLLRAPYGSKPYMKEEFRDLTASWGYRIWDWNVDSRDSIKKNTLGDEVYEQVAAQIEYKQQAVLLFHDREHTLQALPRIIDLLISKGFEIKKIDKNMTPLNFWNDIR